MGSHWTNNLTVP